VSRFAPVVPFPELAPVVDGLRERSPFVRLLEEAEPHRRHEAATFDFGAA
jgi:hypothetical protein